VKLLKPEAPTFKKIVVLSQCLKTSDKIAKDYICVQIAQKFSPLEFREIYNECWLRIRLRELNDPTWQADDHRKYFKTVVSHYWIEYKKKRKPAEFVADESEFQYCEADLLWWCNTRSGNEDVDFYKEILTLAHRCKNIRDACRMCDMHPDVFYGHYNEAKKRFKDDLIQLRTADDLNRNGLV